VVDARESMGVIADRPTHDVVDRAPSFGAVGARDATQSDATTPRDAARPSIGDTDGDAARRRRDDDDANGRRANRRCDRSASTTDARRATGD